MVPTQIDSESCGLCLIMVSLGDNIDHRNSLLLLTKYIYLQSINKLLLDREIKSPSEQYVRYKTVIQRGNTIIATFIITSISIKGDIQSTTIMILYV